MTQVTIGFEIMSLIVCIVVFYGNSYETKQKNKRRKVFSTVIAVLFVAMLADLISWIYDGQAEHIGILNFSTLLSTSLCFVISSLYIWYVYLFITEKRAIPFLPFKISIIYSVLALVVTIIFSAKGLLYYFEAGIYYEGAWYNVYLTANAVNLIYGFIVILISAKYLGVHDCIASISYMAVPFISMCVNAIVPDLSLTYPAITISILIVYIMMQAEHETILIRSERIKAMQMLHDDLTGVYNRRAYTETVERLCHGENQVGVIFCDINGLKYTNDNFGHEAGDKLICDFADLLQGYFRKDSVYRISGDEFVVVVPSITEGSLKTRIDLITKRFSAYDCPMASVGFAYGMEADLHQLINEAETNMYETKKKFYEEYPLFRR